MTWIKIFPTIPGRANQCKCCNRSVCFVLVQGDCFCFSQCLMEHCVLVQGDCFCFSQCLMEHFVLVQGDCFCFSQCIMEHFVLVQGDCFCFSQCIMEHCVPPSLPKNFVLRFYNIVKYLIRSENPIVVLVFARGNLLDILWCWLYILPIHGGGFSIISSAKLRAMFSQSLSNRAENNVRLMFFIRVLFTGRQYECRFVLDMADKFA